MRRARPARSVEQESDDFVSIDTRSEYEAQVRVTCPDKTGLGSDITRTIFDFGLVTTKGDFATDGKWAFVLVTVMKQSAILHHGSGLTSGTSSSGNTSSNSAGPGVNWQLLKQRLENLCPSKQSISTLSTLNLTAISGSGMNGDGSSANSSNSNLTNGHTNNKKTMYILQVEVQDRVGLLHDVTQELWASELTVHRAHISTSPEDTAVDLFYVTDEKNELPNQERVDEISKAVQRVAGKTANSTANVVLTPAPSFVNTRQSSGSRLFEQGSIGRIETASATQYTEATVTVDNLMSEKHTVFQIRTRDRKGLLYDVLRASKDLEVKVNYAKVVLKVDQKGRGNFARSTSQVNLSGVIGLDDGVDEMSLGDSGVNNSRKGNKPTPTHLCEIDLFVGRCTNVRERRYLCQRYKENVERPVSVQIMTAGLDETTTELRVIAPLDISGFTRPRVLLDVTEALRQLKVMVFKADILIDDTKTHGENGVNSQDFINPNSDTSDSNYLDGLKKTSARQEVHRFLLTDANGQPIASVRDRKIVVNRVLGVLLQ